MIEVKAGDFVSFDRDGTISHINLDGTVKDAISALGLDCSAFDGGILAADIAGAWIEKIRGAPDEMYYATIEAKSSGSVRFFYDSKMKVSNILYWVD